jgi:hypothetical protein
MNRFTDEPLIAREVSIRRTEQENLKTQQQKDMDQRRIAAPQSTWNQSVAASTNTYMRNALTQVRKSDVTHNEDLLRLHGTWIHNQK